MNLHEIKNEIQTNCKDKRKTTADEIIRGIKPDRVKKSAKLIDSSKINRKTIK